MTNSPRRRASETQSELAVLIFQSRIIRFALAFLFAIIALDVVIAVIALRNLN